MLAVCLHVSAATLSQKVSISGKDMTLESIIQAIKGQTGLEFLYDDSVVQHAHRISLDARNESVGLVLDRCMQGQRLGYAIKNNIIVITTSAEPAVAHAVAATEVVAPPTNPEIRGTVRNESGQPIPGVTVSLKGTKMAVMTDEKGQFVIRAGKEDQLVFSYVGYVPVTVKVGDRTEVPIVLQPKSQELNEVVMRGYGTQLKAKVTGAMNTVKMDDVLGNRPVSTTASLLQNVVPGLEVDITSGQPGASSTFNIRGGTDFGSNPNSAINAKGPFILVDNIPFNGPLNMIDPADIESVTVLKDAGSAAIYGARSAFGVILITTKSGKKNQKLQIDYNNNLTFASPMGLPQRATPIQQVQSWIDCGSSAPPTYWGAQNFQTWMQLLTDYQKNPGNYPKGYSVQNNVYYQLAPVDQTKELLGHRAFQQTHNVSLSGGSDKITYRFSFGTTNEKGIIVPEANQDAFKRYTAKSIVTADMASWISTQFDANYDYSSTLSPYNTNAFAFATETPNVLPDSLPSGQGLSTVGPITTARNTILSQYPTSNINNDLRMTGRTILKPMKGLTVTGEYTFDNLVNNTNTYDKLSNNLVSTYTLTQAVTGTGMFTENMAKTNYQVLNVFANYSKSIADHNMSLMAGFNQEQSDYFRQTLSATGMYDVNKPAITTATGTIAGSDNVDQFSNQGVFGRFNYDYKAKYLLELDGRYDGSSKFPVDHRWGFFPSASAGWRISEEPFMNALRPWLNELKFRGSVGTVGNQSIPDYSYYSSMYAYSPYWLEGGVPALSLSSPSLVSSSFTWETVKTTDFGVNWGFIKNKLTGAFDWYRRNTSGILTSAPTALPAVLGTGAPLQNSGALQSTGFELSINWKDKIGKVNYYIGANLYNFTTVVTNAVNPNKALSNLYTGEKMGEIWGYVTDRLYTVNDFTAPANGWAATGYTGGTLNKGIAAFSNETPNPGDVKYKKFDTSRAFISNGANTLADHGDMQRIGNSTPQYQFGINGGVSYQHFDFSFVVGGTMKQDLWLNNGLTMPNYWQSYSQLYANETNYWTPTNLNAHYGRIYYQGGNQGFNQNTVQTRYMMNGAYLRVRNLTARYTLPACIIKKMRLNRLQVYYSIENPFEFDHLPKGVYPDVANQGGGSGSGLGYPFMRKSSFGVNLSF